MKITDLLKESVQIYFDYKVGNNTYKIEVEYNWHVTPGQYLAMGEEPDLFKRLIKYISIFVRSWNLTDDDGKMVPISEKSLMGGKIPTELLSMIVNEISESRASIKARESGALPPHTEPAQVS